MSSDPTPRSLPPLLAPFRQRASAAWAPWAAADEPAPTQLCLPGFRDRPYLGAGVPTQVAIWVLRMLARTEAREAYVRHRRTQRSIDDLLGVDDGRDIADVASLSRLAVEQLERFEAQPPEGPGQVQANTALLGAALGLTALECALLELRAQLWTQPPLEDLLNNVFDAGWTDDKLARVLAAALDVSERASWSLLDRGAPLYRSGLLDLSDVANGGFADKLRCQFGLINALHRPARDVMELLRYAVGRAPEPALDVSAFPHLKRELDALARYLGAAVRERTAGVNVLLHGAPGVGKSELARAIPRALGLEAFEIANEQPGDRESELDRRLKHYQASQALLGGVGGAVIVFDEIENALPRGAFFGEAKHSIKARLNRLLESNPLPAFWIANDIGHIDPAYVRRFDFVLEVRPPPRAARIAILRESLAGLPVGARWVERQAEDAAVSPATSARFARVLRCLGSDQPTELEATWESLAREHRRASGLPARRPVYPPIDDYRIEWLNVDVDLAGLGETLRRRGQGRLLFHGPPGTGKTAFAHHLARTIDRPLMVRRASDLLSMWVSGTEKNLAAMFDEAAADGAVLLLDEADSFLQDRSAAQRSWEVTEVNELLTQMESFDGIFICATNFLPRLDPAAMRRFALKLEFRPLRAGQALALFAATYRRLAGRDLRDGERAAADDGLRRLPALTPGDFAAATGRWELLDRAPMADELLDALREECALKPGSARPMGF